MDIKFTTLLVIVAGFYIHGCSSTESELPRFRNKYYFVEKNSLNWHDAWAKCNTRNMKLLSIESQEENDFLNEYLRKELILLLSQNKFHWTAGTKYAQDGTFYWSGSGKFVNYTNWGEGSPNKVKNDDFVLVRISGSNDELKWANVKSGYLCTPICEKTVDFP